MTIPARRRVVPSAVWEWAAGALRDVGAARPKVIRRVDGIQATILVVGESGDSPLFAIKVFRHDPASAGLLSREVTALGAFHEALAGRDDLGCPRPIASSADLLCYLMTYEAGSPIESAARPSSPAYGEIVDRLLAGLGLFYDAVGDIYGDFHPGNVLVARGQRVILLDPGVPNPINPTFQRLADELRFSPASVDLGYWTFTVSSRTARLAVVRPPAVVRRWRLTEELLPRAAHRMAPAGEADRFLTEVLEAAGAYLAWMRGHAGRRGPVLSAIGGATARRLVRRSRRRVAA